MEKMSKLDVGFVGLVPSFVKVLEEWKPETMKMETHYRDALLEYLRSRVPDDARVEKEYRHNGTTADLFVVWKGMIFDDQVFFEIKRNLQKKSDFDRLVGQIESMKPGDQNIIIVLIGKTDEGLRGRLFDKYNSAIDTTSNTKLAVVVKSVE